MNIWLISAFEPTPIDNTRPMRFMGIAEAAINRGHKITLFTSTFKHNTKQHRYAQNTNFVINNNYEVVFIHSMAYKKNISFKRVFAHLDFANKLIKGISNMPKPAIVVISLPPLSSVDKIVSWCKLNNIPVIVDIIDPWPDVFLKAVPNELKWLGNLLLFPFYSKLKRIFRNCTGVTAISNQYINWATTYLNENSSTACFYPAIQLKQVREEWLKFEGFLIKTNNKLRVIYAGSLASSYDVKTILAAAEILNRKYPFKTEFAIAGTGYQEAIVIEKIKVLPNVVYLGWLDQNQIMREFYLSDLGLIQHVKNATQSITYKLFDYLGAGLPVLNSLQSEMVNIIENNYIGLNNNSEDAEMLASNIEKFLLDKELLKNYKQNALNFTSNFGDSAVVYDKFVQFIENATPLSMPNL
jgi:glycosyltransferase involved in cell wall biosynthesis